MERACAISEVAFRGYPSHYHADPRLDRAACDAVYPDWTRRLCAERGDDRITLVMEHEGGSR